MHTLLITGGTGKFGKVLVEHFVSQGHTVLFTSRSADSIQSTLAAYPDAKGRLHGFVTDFTEPDAVQHLIAEISDHNFSVTALVNNARSLNYLGMESNGTVSRDNFVGELTMDVVVPYELSMGLAKAPNTALSHIINIGSMYGCTAANPKLYTNFEQQSPLHYGVAKAALSHLTKELAVRLAPHVLVNCVAYGGVDGRVDDAFRQRYADLAPLGRMLTEAEIPGPIDFLLSNQVKNMTGQTLQIDGGWTLW